MLPTCLLDGVIHYVDYVLPEAITIQAELQVSAGWPGCKESNLNQTMMSDLVKGARLQGVESACPARAPGPWPCGAGDAAHWTRPARPLVLSTRSGVAYVRAGRPPGGRDALRPERPVNSQMAGAGPVETLSGPSARRLKPAPARETGFLDRRAGRPGANALRRHLSNQGSQRGRESPAVARRHTCARRRRRGRESLAVTVARGAAG